MARPTAALVETTRRSQLADAADYGDCVSHSSYFWGFRLHGLFALDGTPRAWLSPRPSSPNATPALPSSTVAPAPDPSNATVPAPCRSRSTTASADHHARSSTPPPEPVERLIESGARRP
jgi:hypothetical protein